MPLPVFVQDYQRRLTTRLQPLLNRLSDEWEELPPEKQQRMRLAGLAVAAALPFLLVVLPLVVGRISAHNQLAEARERLQKMRDLERTVLELRLNEGANDQPKESKNTSLIAVLDGLAQKAAVGGNVQSMRPVNSGRKDSEDEEAVEIQLKDVVLQEFLKLLYEIEVGGADLTVRRLELSKEGKTTNQLRVSLEVVQ